MGNQGCCCKSDSDHALRPVVLETGKKDNRPKLRTKILNAAARKVKEIEDKLNFGVLCIDEGHWETDVRLIETESGVSHWGRCKGVTRETLEAPKLKFAALQAISECYRKLIESAGMAGLVGVSADLGYVWLKHTAEVKKVVDGNTPVYLTPLVQLPMISAAFKEFELSLLVTWGQSSEEEHVKQAFVKDSNLSDADLSRLMVLGIDLTDPLCQAFLRWESTDEQNQLLGEKIFSLIQDRIERVNVSGKKDRLIKAIILTARLSIFSDMLRESTKLPVFDERTQMQFFSSGLKLSHYNDAAVLARLDVREKTKCPTEWLNGEKPKLGLMLIDYKFPPTFGDLENSGTLAYETVARMVPGLYFEVAQAGSMEPKIMEAVAATIKELEAAGVMGITGNCGFLMFYQCFARYIAKVPVFMSSLIQASTLAAAIDCSERIMILTANDQSLMPGKDKLLLESGIHVTDSDRFFIYGLQDVPGFEAVALGQRVDTIKVQTHLNQIIPELIEKEKSNGPIKMILMECTELPHFADGLRKLTQLPVFDCVTMVNYFYNATSKTNWDSHTWAPHNPDFWSAHYDMMGRDISFR